MSHPVYGRYVLIPFVPLFRPTEASTSGTVGDIVCATSRLALEPNFLSTAFERVAQKFGSEEWRDPSAMKTYLWECPALEERSGDEAEKSTIKFLLNPQISELLREPVYLISGLFRVI